MNTIDIFIGDVHGRSDLLRKLLQFVGRHTRIRDSEPRFTFLGDLIDRGSDSKSCVSMAIDATRKAPGSVILLGNHEDMMLDTIKSLGTCDASANWAMTGGMQTIESYVGEVNLSKFFNAMNDTYSHHIETMKNAPLYVRRGGLIAVHAGIDPTIKLEDQTKGILLWIRDNFLEYADPEMAPVIHGHTIMNKLPIITENRISIDTGSYHNDALTACIVDPSTWEISFAQATSKTVRYVDPIKLDRGYGTLLDNPERIFKQRIIDNKNSMFNKS